MTEYPSYYADSTQTKTTATYGAFQSVPLGLLKPMINFDTTLATEIDLGPNRGLTFFNAQPPINDISGVWIHPALYGGLDPFFATLWYNEQQGQLTLWTNASGQDSTYLPGCDWNGVALLLSQTEMHEGWVSGGISSHYKRLVDSVNSAHLDSTLEVATVLGSKTFLQQYVNDSVLQPFNNRLSAGQQELEDSDYPRIFGKTLPSGKPISFGAIGCYPVYLSHFPRP